MRCSWEGIQEGFDTSAANKKIRIPYFRYFEVYKLWFAHECDLLLEVEAGVDHVQEKKRSQALCCIMYITCRGLK